MGVFYLIFNMYRITINGLSNLTKNLGGVETASNAIFKNAMDQSLTAVTNIAKANSPFKTGKLRRSIHPIMKNVLEGQVSTGTEYAKYVEEGTRPHVIVPKRAKVLAFKVGGSMVFARRVNHPGFAGRWYMKKSGQQSVNVVKGIYERAFSKLVHVIFN